MKIYYTFLAINIAILLIDCYCQPVRYKDSIENPDDLTLPILIFLSFCSWVGTIIMGICLALDFIIKLRGEE